jgi:uncharacterized membrane protein
MVRDSLIEITLTAFFTALYAVGVVALAPVSFLIFQVRVADSLLPLAIIFGLPACIGFSIGALVANMFGGLGMVDVLGGSSANLIACVVAWKLGQRRLIGGWFLATVAQNIILTVIVGTYLAYLLGFPIIVGWTGIFLGSVVAVNLLGYPLLKAVSRPSILRLLTSNGIRVYSEV